MPKVKLTAPMKFCPITKDGQHKLRRWEGNNRFGRVCHLCHKTWEYHDGTLRPTYRDDLKSVTGFINSFAEIWAMELDRGQRRP